MPELVGYASPFSPPKPQGQSSGPSVPVETKNKPNAGISEKRSSVEIFVSKRSAEQALPLYDKAGRT